MFQMLVVTADEWLEEKSVKFELGNLNVSTPRKFRPRIDAKMTHQEGLQKDRTVDLVE
jgi:hypothetical protein